MIVIVIEIYGLKLKRKEGKKLKKLKEKRKNKFKIGLILIVGDIERKMIVGESWKRLELNGRNKYWLFKV